jgi:TolB-like protein/DNA-binding winged helix-turn-helix (wHTH) protein/Tfp pilus assembly protein PilF
MSELPPPPSVLRFGAFEADLRAGELRAHGRKIKLQEKPFQLLCVLLQHPGEVVSREELREKLWPADTFVEFDDSLNHAINRLREALGDTAEKPHFVETLPRRGYRFIYPVEGAPSAQAKIPPLWVWAVGAGLAVVFLLAVALNPGGLRHRLLGRPAPGEITSIAVLPLENLSGDPEQEYFSDGMTEALITELGKVSALRVISRQSVMQYKGSDKPVAEIARELNVDAVVEGSAAREGNRVRITVQLILPTPEQHLWADSYERDLSSVLALQSEVARAITRNIKATVSPEEKARLARDPRVNPEAYDAYLRGRQFWELRTKEGLAKALEHFQKSVQIDPQYALGYVGLADTYLILWENSFLPRDETFPKAKVAIEKALELDASLAEAHSTQATFFADYWDWAGAERAFKRALQLNPGYATAHHWYGLLLSEMGRHAEAIAEIKTARTLDPLSPRINANVGHCAYLARRYDEAIHELQKALELHPEHARTYVYLSRTYSAKGLHEQAIATAQKALQLGDPQGDLLLAQVLALAGKRDEATKIVRKALQSDPQYVSPVLMTWAYAALGEHDAAFAWLEKAYAERSGMPYLRTQPAFDPLRSDPRFQHLLRRMNFPN